MDYLNREIVARLRELSAGAEPTMRREGICLDLECTVGNAAFYRAREVFVEMGLDKNYPLGKKEYKGPDLWFGDHGVLRRALARRVARYMEEHLL